MAKTHHASRLALQGRVDVEIEGAKLGDRVLVVVEGTLRAFEEISSAHEGDFEIAKARTGEALLLTDDQARDFAETFETMRHEKAGGVRGQIGLMDEYTNLTLGGLRVLCTDRKLGWSKDDSEDDLRGILRRADR